MSSRQLDVLNTIKKSERVFHLPNRLLVGAGPTNFSPRVLSALSRCTIGPLCDEQFQMMDDIQKMLKYVFQTNNDFTLTQQVTATGITELAITNLLDPGEKVIVAVGGTWGDRMVEMAKRRDLEVIKLVSPPGEVFSFDELESEIIKHKPAALMITHGESSGGTIQPLDGLGKICHKYNCLLLVDVVVTLGAVPLFIDRWEIDVGIAGAQKAIGAPAGMALLTLSPRAVEKLKSNKCPPPFYYDLKRAGVYWKYFQDNIIDNKMPTFQYTYNSHMLAAVREALIEICEEGLENVWKRHERNSERFWVGLEKMGLQFFVRKDIRLCTVTCLLIPPKVKLHVLRNYLVKNYDVVVMPGMGRTADIVMRIGFMGYNSRPEVVDFILKVLDEAIKYCQSEEEQNKND